MHLRRWTEFEPEPNMSLLPYAAAARLLPRPLLLPSWALGWQAALLPSGTRPLGSSSRTDSSCAHLRHLTTSPHDLTSPPVLDFQRSSTSVHGACLPACAAFFFHPAPSYSLSCSFLAPSHLPCSLLPGLRRYRGRQGNPCIL